MTLEEAFYSDLSSVTNITNLTGTRIYPLVLQQTDTFPAIVYQRISTPRQYSHSGYSGIAIARLQLDIISETLSVAQTISGYIRSRYAGYSGTMGTVRISSIEVDDEQHFYDEVTKKKTIIIDLIINHYES